MCPSEHVISKCDMVTSVLQVGDDVPVQDSKLIMQHTLALQPAGNMLLMRRAAAGRWH